MMPLRTGTRKINNHMLDRYNKKDVIKKMIKDRDATGYEYYWQGSKKRAKDKSGPWSSHLETTQAVFPSGPKK